MMGGGFGGSVLALLPPDASPGPDGSVAVSPAAPPRRPALELGPSSSSLSGSSSPQATNRTPTASIATPTHRFRFQPAALSTSASEAPSPSTNRIAP